MNWYELKSKCIDQVASEIARTRLSPGHNRLPTLERISRWNEETVKARDEAVEKIKAMNGLELLDLISEVVGDEEART